MVEISLEILDVGTACAVLDQATGVAELKWLFVEWGHRGKGFGQRLLLRMEGKLKHHGAREITLIADAIDASDASGTYLAQLIKWYERQGYLRLGEQKFTKQLR